MNFDATIRRVYDLINAGDIDGFGTHLADDFVDHEELPGHEPNKEGAIAFFRMFVAAFPDLRMTVEDVITSGDKAVARVRAAGTHQGPFMGMSASGRRIDVSLIDIMSFGSDGRVREHWGVLDQLTMMQQLGAIPAAPSA
jgi:steroid delta-isomerase-like uncharacterized protein